MSGKGIDLCAVPIRVGPDGKWDFVNFKSLTTESITVCAVLSALAAFFALPRIYVNRRRLLLADYFTILALVFSIAYAVLISLMARFYRHDQNIPACWIDKSFAKLQFCLTFFSGPVQFFPRAAIFLLYRQLFQIHSRAVHIAIWAGVIFTFLATAPNIPLAIIFQAPHPGETWMHVLMRLWDPTNGRDFRSWGPIQGGASVVLDIFAFILPLPIIARLNLNSRRKIQLLLLFSTAFLGVVASTVAFVYKVKLVILASKNSGEEFWTLGYVNICIDIESNVAIIVGSMPAFANFMRSHVVESGAFQSLRSKLRGSNSTGQVPSGTPAQPLHGTIGSPLPRRKPAYYELTDSHLLDSKYTISGGTVMATTTTVGPGQLYSKSSRE